ncbi:MAG: threonine aldolase, partial [Candidatus Thorarchaeota archaeon]|nr:threonine aldolase [Candidatus Thorarchaeota archaeon]
LLSDGLEELGFKILFPVRTNMTYIDYSVIGWTAQDFIQNCEKLGWKARARGNSTRLCTHYGIEREDIESFLEGLKKLI